EAFELLTLMQTGRSPLVPVVMLDLPGSTYWVTWRDFIERELLSRQLISPHDLDVFKITDSVDEAVDELTGFYEVFHSSRTVGRRLVLRLNRDIDDALLERLNREMADIVASG